MGTYVYEYSNPPSGIRRATNYDGEFLSLMARANNHTQAAQTSSIRCWSTDSARISVIRER